MYYMLECFGPVSPPRVSLKNIPMIEDVSWNRAAVITAAVPDPIRVDLRAQGGDVMVPMFNVGILVLRDDVIAAMTAAGVDNLQVFNLVIHDGRTGQDIVDYKAVNIIGKVAVANLAESDAIVHGGPLIDVDFDSLSIDEDKARDLAVFRLAESVSGIVVHERVKRSVEASGIQGLDFVEPKDWVG